MTAAGVISPAVIFFGDPPEDGTKRHFRVDYYITYSGLREQFYSQTIFTWDPAENPCNKGLHKWVANPDLWIEERVPLIDAEFVGMTVAFTEQYFTFPFNCTSWFSYTPNYPMWTATWYTLTARQPPTDPFTHEYFEVFSVAESEMDQLSTMIQSWWNQKLQLLTLSSIIFMKKDAAYEVQWGTWEP